MKQKRQVYLLDARQYTPETIAVSFAKTSRSPQSFSEIAAELSDTKSSQFHEKWVVGYGHASVAEHAVLHIALENISRLAVEIVQSNRLASYTEKSTRYQQWGLDQFFIPSELEKHPFRDVYVNTCVSLFKTYQTCLQKLNEYLTDTSTQQPGELVETWQRRIRSRCTDVCRFLLPSSALANVGITINARSLEYAISKMLSHPLEEVRSIGEEIKLVALQSVPTLVKYADASTFLKDVENTIVDELLLQDNTISVEDITEDDWLHAHNLDAKAENHILAAVLYRFTRKSYQQCLNIIQNLSQQQRQHLVSSITSHKTKFQTMLRELEYAYFCFDTIMDQGCYYELKRHRMMSLTPQPLTACLGYAVPKLISDAGLDDQYHEAMHHAKQTYLELSQEFPSVASYIVPNAFNRRVLTSLNLRNAMHLISLRTASNAHFSIRRFAHRIAEEIGMQVPLFSSYLIAESNENWRNIEKLHFSHTIYLSK